MSPEAAVAEIHRQLSAEPERMFSAFANAEMVSRWLGPSPEIKLTVLKRHFRIGGAHRFAYHVPDGRVMTVNGTYQSIEPPSSIVFSRTSNHPTSTRAFNPR